MDMHHLRQQGHEIFDQYATPAIRRVFFTGGMCMTAANVYVSAPLLRDAEHTSWADLATHNLSLASAAAAFFLLTHVVDQHLAHNPDNFLRDY